MMQLDCVEGGWIERALWRPKATLDLEDRVLQSCYVNCLVAFNSHEAIQDESLLALTFNAQRVGVPR